MRRLLAAGAVATVVAFGAACGDSGSGNGEQASEGQTGGPTDNTAQVCADAQTVQAEESQKLQEDMAALQEQGLPDKKYEEAALVRMEEALVTWSDGLHEQAELADDPALSEALTGLADGLADAAPKLTRETVRTGEIPGSDKLNAYGQTLTALCSGPTPQAPSAPPTQAPAPSPTG